MVETLTREAFDQNPPTQFEMWQAIEELQKDEKKATKDSHNLSTLLWAIGALLVFFAAHSTFILPLVVSNTVEKVVVIIDDKIKTHEEKGVHEGAVTNDQLDLIMQRTDAKLESLATATSVAILDERVRQLSEQIKELQGKIK